VINLLTGKQESRTNRTSLLNHAIIPSQSKPREGRTIEGLFLAGVTSRKKDLRVSRGRGTREGSLPEIRQGCS